MANIHGAGIALAAAAIGVNKRRRSRMASAKLTGGERLAEAKLS